MVKAILTLKPAMKAEIGEENYYSTPSLTSGLDGCVSSKPRPLLLPPGIEPGTHWCIGGTNSLHNAHDLDRLL